MFQCFIGLKRIVSEQKRCPHVTYFKHWVCRIAEVYYDVCDNVHMIKY